MLCYSHQVLKTPQQELLKNSAEKNFFALLYLPNISQFFYDKCKINEFILKDFLTIKNNLLLYYSDKSYFSLYLRSFLL